MKITQMPVYYHPVFERHLTGRLLEALADTPVTVLLGARQVGKSTLAQSLLAAGEIDDYVSLDDPVAASAASQDPTGFVASLPGRVAIDEVQTVPSLLPAIKRSVDRDRRPGRFLLTGSANLFRLPSVGESLAGRMQLETLWPLSQGEIGGVRETFLDEAFSTGSATTGTRSPGSEEIVDRVLRGGLPELVARAPARRAAWLESYVVALLQRDVRDIARVGRLGDVGRLLGVVAARAPSLLNVAALSRDVGVPATTVSRYLGLLEQLFLVHLVPAWHANLGQRLLKSPKALIADSALHAHLMGLGPGAVARDRDRLGPLLENFVGMELVKQIGWSPVRRRLHHLRTAKGGEVDFVVEDDAGRLVAIEVKASATVRSDDFRWIRDLASRLAGRFVGGVVLYTGDARVAFAEDLVALPVGSLWAGGRGWAVAAGPSRVDRPGLDAAAWSWLLEGDDGPREVEVQISRTALQVDRAQLSEFARRAIETQGRSVVEGLIRRSGDPPALIRVHSASTGLPQV